VPSRRVAAGGETLDEYQRVAARTMNAGITDEERLIDAAAGLAEEAGEVLGLVRKHLYMGHALDRELVTKELGDALWCVAAVATCLGLTLEEIAAANLGKLRSRYPDGYSDEASRTRVD
jgi:NTP pyrophosphatase (non-canonical NTP hydrolase)